MSWGTLTVGRLYLRETYELSHQVNATTGEQSVTIEGLESSPPWTGDQLRARQEDVIALYDRALPVVFSSKDNHSGFYTVSDTGSKLTNWPEAEFFGWNLSLKRIGTENAVDMESRLASVVRLNNFALTGERWHAPAVGAYGYFLGIGGTPSGTVSRVLADSEGTITVYRGIPAGVNPTWGITAPNYLLGRVRFKADSQERSGTGIRLDATGWELTNGLVRVTPLSSSGILRVESWDGGAYSVTPLDIAAAGGTLAAFDSVTLLKNDFECVVVRLVKSLSPSGRVLCDLTLRRGSRFVEGFIQSSASNTISLTVNGGLATTNNAASGYIVASGDDAAGNRYIMGSAHTFTGSTGGVISLATTTSFGFFAGHVIGGGSPVSGDGAATLVDQYIGSLAEQTLAVKR